MQNQSFVSDVLECVLDSLEFEKQCTRRVEGLWRLPCMAMPAQKKPLKVQDGDEEVAGRNKRKKYFPIDFTLEAKSMIFLAHDPPTLFCLRPLSLRMLLDLCRTRSTAPAINICGPWGCGAFVPESLLLVGAVQSGQTDRSRWQAWPLTLFFSVCHL